ncbi:Hypothetical protein SMAX5B_010950 [Scophthalmus maximus]|uniref:Uncharacterized protein n=1 Tax=Scophthalmus maximus TaxID=52904 RepID=A0A2U9BRD9_SCOMX|nr:Hypothetical protein SMAX5B_010950 [Scophthalmus maximus]
MADALSSVCGSLCVVPDQSSALTQFGASWPGIGGNGSRREPHQEPHQNSQHEQRYLEHTVKLDH